MGERNYYQLANLFSFLGKHDRGMKSCEKCENGEATGNNIYSFSPCPFMTAIQAKMKFYSLYLLQYYNFTVKPPLSRKV